MSELNMQRLLGAAIFGIIAALLLPSIFGGRSDVWGAWIFDYQTLITGFLALGAAYITVSQMQRSDERAEQRHRELADLQLRPYALKVERLCQPTLQDILIFCREIDEMAPLSVPETGDEPSEKVYYREWLGKVTRITEAFDKLLERPSWADDGEVMNGWTKYLHGAMKGVCDEISDAARRQIGHVNRFRVYGNTPVERSAAEEFEKDEVHLYKIFELQELALEMVKDLRALAKQYKVDTGEID